MAQLFLKRIDWILVFCLLPILTAGLFTMKSFTPEEGGVDFFGRQIIWVCLSLVVFFIFSSIDFRFIKRTGVLVTLFLFFLYLSILLFFGWLTILSDIQLTDGKIAAVAIISFFMFLMFGGTLEELCK
jgi:cell division protein FtsW (lipid II flippase)